MKPWIPFALLVILIVAIGYGVFAPCPSQDAARTSAAGARAANATPADNAATGRFDPVMSGVCRFSCAADVAYEPQDLAAQPGVHHGDLTRCPVSRVVFAVAENRPRVAHSGREYVVCCDTCAEKLRKDPARFLRS